MGGRLTFPVRDSPNALKACIHYNDDLFDNIDLARAILGFRKHSHLTYHVGPVVPFTVITLLFVREHDVQSSFFRSSTCNILGVE